MVWKNVGKSVLMILAAAALCWVAGLLMNWGWLIMAVAIVFIAVVYVSTTGSVITKDRERVNRTSDELNETLRTRLMLASDLTGFADSCRGIEFENSDDLKDAILIAQDSNTIQEREDAENALTYCIDDLLHEIDEYPQIAKRGYVQNIASNMNKNEKELKDKLRSYNSAVVLYNHRCTAYPSCMLADSKGYVTEPEFKLVLDEPTEKRPAAEEAADSEEPAENPMAERETINKKAPDPEPAEAEEPEEPEEAEEEYQRPDEDGADTPVHAAGEEKMQPGPDNPESDENVSDETAAGEEKPEEQNDSSDRQEEEYPNLFDDVEIPRTEPEDTGEEIVSSKDGGDTDEMEDTVQIVVRDDDENEDAVPPAGSDEEKDKNSDELDLS
jgi:LemA protein